jgi:hypothetical protein
MQPSSMVFGAKKEVSADFFLRSKTALLSAQEGPNETNLYPPQAG